MMAQEGGRSIDIPQHCNVQWWVVNATPRPAALPQEKDPVLRCGWALRSVWKGTENLAPTGVQTPDQLKCHNFTMTTISLQTSVAIAHCIYYTITHFSHTGITVYYTAQMYQNDSKVSWA